MKKKGHIFYLNEWKKSTSKEFFYRKSLVNKNKFFYAESNNDDVKKTILSAKIGLKKNKQLSLFERKKFIYKIYKRHWRQEKILVMQEKKFSILQKFGYMHLSL